MSDTTETTPEPRKFDFSAYPEDTLFYDRRQSLDRRTGEEAAEAIASAQAAEAELKATKKVPGERRAKKERRKRIDPTTFEKQYSYDEIEFMTAMQKFKERTTNPFPSHREVLDVAYKLGYRRVLRDEDLYDEATEPVEPSAVEAAAMTAS
jgi:hypothetical protein